MHGSRTADVIIIGGGLHGCSAALQLAKRGLRPLLIEKDYVARHASGVNAGGVRRLGRALPEVPLSVASMQMWHRIGELVDDDCGFVSHGQVRIAENESELEMLRLRAASVRGLGFDHEELIDAPQLRALVPAAATHCVGGLVCRTDGAALPYRTTTAFARKAEQLGAQIIEGVCAQRVGRSGSAWRVQTSHGDFIAPRILNCAGAWAGAIAAQLEEPVPLQAIAPMLMITEPVEHFVNPVVGAAGRTLSFKQFANGTVLIGGGLRGRADLDTSSTELDFAQLAINAQTVQALFPALRSVRIVRAWAGIEGRMPDDLPVIGPSSTQEGVWHAFGFSAHGFQLGPIVGEAIADLMTGRDCAFDLTAFDIRRFMRRSADASVAPFAQ